MGRLTTGGDMVGPKVAKSFKAVGIIFSDGVLSQQLSELEGTHSLD